MRRASDALVATTIGGRYRVVAPLGRGGAGHVYLAIQEPLGREVALKVLRTDIDEQSREEFAGRFLREAAVTSRLQHPNLVTIHDYGTIEGDQPYVVMERLRGRTLAEHLQEGPFAPEEVARIGAGLARGLRHAHAEGLVHRDVKPRNIVLEPDESGLRPVLLDFGLVKARVQGDSVETRVGTYMGTPAYMAPEQSKASKELDGRADLYALGCVLYKMLTGFPPYEADDPLAMAVAHINDPYPPMATRAPDIAVPEGLEAIVRRCLQKDPDARFADGGELAEALDAYRAQSEIGLPVPGTPQSRRAPWVFLVAVGLMGVGAAGIALVVGVVLGTGAMFMAGPFREAPEAVVQVPETPPHPEAGAELSLNELLHREREEPPGSEDPGGEEPVPAEAPPPVPSGPRSVAAPKPPPATSPKPASAPVAAPKPAPAPVAAPKPAAPQPAPAPAPASAPKPAAPAPAPTTSAPRPAPSAPAGPVVMTVDGVDFTAEQAREALRFINEATEQELHEAGIYRRGVAIILERRPFRSLQAFGDTYQIGTKTVEAVRDATP